MSQVEEYAEFCVRVANSYLIDIPRDQVLLSTNKHAAFHFRSRSAADTAAHKVNVLGNNRARVEPC